MMAEKYEMSASLIRQRRNLITISLIIMFLLYSGVNISKINIFGIEFSTPDHDSIMNTLWLIWLYFLIRYYQYLKAEPSEGAMQLLKTKFNGLCFNVIFGHLNSVCPGKVQVGDCSVLQLERNGFFRFVFPIKKYEPVEDKQVVISREDIPIKILLCPAIKSCWHVVAHSTKFTDNILPYLIAIITVSCGWLR